MTGTILVGRVETEEESRERDRRYIVQMATNRRQFVLGTKAGNDFCSALKRSVLDRREQGITYCVPVQVEVGLTAYGELPDFAAQLDSIGRFLAMGRRDPSGLIPPGDWFASQTLQLYRNLGREFTIDAPAFVPINVCGKANREFMCGVLEIVSRVSTRSREFNARVFSRQRIQMSTGDALTRTVRWNAGRGEKRLSVVIGEVI